MKRDSVKASAAMRSETIPAVSPVTAADDSVVTKARLMLASVAPAFREWSADMMTSVQPDSAAPTAAMPPVVGDLDDDGRPDVVFVGTDSIGPVVEAVLSHGGQPTAAAVTREKELAVGIDLHRSRLALARDEIDGKRRPMLDVIVWDPSGREVALSARFVYRAGRFGILVGGE